MDNTVTAKYFKVSADGNGAPDFLEFLREIAGLELAERETDIAWEGQAALIIRLESLANKQQGFYVGELIRKQTENIPPEANDEGLVPIELSDGGGLAYSSAFSFHKPTSTLLIQANPVAVSHTRFRTYLSDRDSNAEYCFEPIVKPNAWERFNEGASRKLAMRIANPEHLPANFNADAQTVGGAAASIAEALGGPYITIEVSMGTKKGSLTVNAMRRVIQAFQGAHKNNQLDVRMLNAHVKPDEEPKDVIDFLDEFLIFRENFDLPSDAPTRNLQIRANALLADHRTNLAYLTEIYGGN